MLPFRWHCSSKLFEEQCCIMGHILSWHVGEGGEMIV